MIMWGPLFEKQGKKVVLAVLKHKRFSFLPKPLSQLVRVFFYLLSTIVLSKEKLKFGMISMIFFHIYLGQCVLSASIRAFHLSAELQITQFILHRLYTHMYFLLTYGVEMRQKTNSTVLILLFNTYTFSPDSYLLLGVINKDCEEEEPWVALSFLLCHHFHGKQLANTGQ